MALTKEQLENLRVGQELFFKHNRGGSSVVTVDKIGSKYFYLSNKRHYDLVSCKDASGFTSGEIFFSEHVYKEEAERNKLWCDLKGIIAYGNCPSHVTAQDIIQAINKFSKRS
jgi:hypothetical protein